MTSKPHNAKPSKPEPDLRHDIDALFSHLAEEFGHEIAEVKDWTFFMQSPDVDRLAEIASELGDEFDIDLQEPGEGMDHDGKPVTTPLLSIVVRDALEPAQVKELATRFGKIAMARKVQYQGVNCYDAADDDLTMPVEIDEAVWRLENLAEMGLPTDAAFDLQFLIGAENKKMASALVQGLTAKGLTEVEIHEGDEGQCGVSACMPGTAEEADLRAKYATVEKIAQAAKADLLGVRFMFEGDDEEEGDED